MKHAARCSVRSQKKWT